MALNSSLRVPRQEPLILKNRKHLFQNLHSNHEDVEVGRCVHKHLGLSCSWAYEMMSLFFHSPTKKVPANKFSLISKAIS